MKLIRNLLILAMALGTIGMTAGCSKVPAGNVGVKVYLLGNDKGVDTQELGPGRYWIGINEELYLFPTYTQNYVWTKDPTEGSPHDESITFQTVEGMNVGADVGISYHIDAKHVSAIFQKYRKGINEITDIYLRNMVRDAFVDEASTLPIESVYGAGKEGLLKAVEKRVRTQTDPLGIVIERIYLVGSLRLPHTVVTALNAKIEATQKAQQRENEVAEAKAEADKVRAKAHGDADAVKINAAAQAERIQELGTALRENPEVIQLNFIDKWNGIMPRVVTGGQGSQLLMMLSPNSVGSGKK